MTQLGKLQKVDLRSVWKHEATDFSAWLVQPENLDVLAEQLGIEIEPIGTEVSVGRFKIDILAKEPNTNEQIIIENQLKLTNHDHLGKVITYAAGIDARYLIWIVKDVLPEYLKAIEWLNEHLDDEIRCFLIRIEVWQIGDSKPAPRFEVISVKNDWVASIKKATSSNGLSPCRSSHAESSECLTDRCVCTRGCVYKNKFLFVRQKYLLGPALGQFLWSEKTYPRAKILTSDSKYEKPGLNRIKHLSKLLPGNPANAYDYHLTQL